MRLPPPVRSLAVPLILAVLAGALPSPWAPSASAQALLHVLNNPAQGPSFGYSVSGVPDADGDGRGDLLVGAHKENFFGQTEAGAAHLFSGSTGALIRSFVSPQSVTHGRFGYAVAGLPDLDGDGLGDLVVGAFGEYGVARGRVHVFSGATGAPLYSVRSPNAQDLGNFGYSVAAVPDADGDGLGDFVVGAYQEEVFPNPSNSGAAYLFSGATGEPLRTLTSTAPQAGGIFGNAVAGVPDVDGDGRGDVVVGALGQSEGGRAYVFSGATGSPLHVLSPTASGAIRFGHTVAGVPDVDGDGRGDVIVGAFGEDVAGVFNTGAAYLFSGRTGALIRKLTSPNPEVDGFFGVSVAAVGDVDGDGRGDVVVGAGQERVGAVEDAGRAYVFSGATGALLFGLASPTPGNALSLYGNFGLAVAGVPDATGNGRGDVLVGAKDDSAPGRAYAFRGSPAPPLPLLLGLYGAGGPVTRGDTLHVGLSLVNQTGGPLAVDVLLQADAPTGPDLFGPLALGLLLEPGVPYRSMAPFPIPIAAAVGPYVATVGAVEVGGGVLATAAFSFDVENPAPLSVTAWAMNSPVPRGDTLDLAVRLVNPNARPVTIDVGLNLTPPGGGSTITTLATGVSVAAGATDTLTSAVPIPAHAPVGLYRGTVSAGEAGFPMGLTILTFEVAFGVATEPGAEGPLSATVNPNPTPRHAVVAFALAGPSDVRLAVFDVLGREVATVEAGHLSTGSHRLALDLSGLPSGGYVWRLVAGERVETGRLTVVR